MIEYCPSMHTPFDDEIDTVEEAERFLKQYEEGQLSLIDMRDLKWAADIISALLDDLDAA